MLQRFARHPQGVWLRKALFQVHLWTGIGVGLYIFVISLTGSAIVFRKEITRLAWSSPIVVPSGPLKSAAEIGAAAKKKNPRFDVTRVTMPARPDRVAVVLMTRGQRQVERAFDPYTARDLGVIGNDEPVLLYRLVQLHDDLLGGRKGRLVNGIGAILVTVLCLTGLVIWWPGIARWWRSLIVVRRVGWARFNWDVHSAIGFWMFAFVLMWGISGIYLSFPAPFANLVDYLQPLDAASREPRSGDEWLAWLARVHFGRAYGTPVKWLYVILGLAPAVLFVTGAIMWWHRVLGPAFRKNRRRATAAPAAVPAELPAAQTPELNLET
jgi:uncharacterized iron-regulated membrane protein